MSDLGEQSYYRFCGPQNLSYALRTLYGIIDGISLDGDIDEREAKELRDWCSENANFRKINPFNEIIPIIDEALGDGDLELDELEDLRWFLNKATQENDFYTGTTAGLQQLQGLLHGILADGFVSQEEAQALSNWLEDNHYLSGCYPYDEIVSILTDALKDGKLDQAEADFLKAFFSQFVTLSVNNQIAIQQGLKKKISVLGVCAVAPEIVFEKNIFCFTGASLRAKRSELASMVESAGGFFSRGMRNEVNYLIYGAGGNLCWAYSCYGRKVERAVNLRKKGHSIQIIHENDFWDCYEDVI